MDTDMGDSGEASSQWTSVNCEESCPWGLCKEFQKRGERNGCFCSAVRRGGRQRSKCGCESLKCALASPDA